MYIEILSKTSQDLLTDAIMKYGFNKQKQRTVRKLMDLGQALLKDIDHEPHNVESSIADVEIMLAQMKLIYSQYTINGFIDAKLEVLNRKIRNI